MRSSRSERNGPPGKSRYSSHLARRLFGGSSTKKRAPASTSPSSLNPPISTWAAAGPGTTSPAAVSTNTSASAALAVMAAPLLSSERKTRRVVRAVYVHVAVQARATHHELERSGVASVRAGGMARLDVALLTESGLRHLEHALVIRTVRVVAARAVLDDGRVLPQEGPSLLGVAPETVVVRRVLLEEGGG